MAGTAGGIVGPLMLGWLRDISGTHMAGILALAAFPLVAAVILELWRRPMRRELSHGK
jgi:MFS-type transporter involved in bile tolerance (Atg22 family)